jgi:TLD
MMASNRFVDSSSAASNSRKIRYFQDSSSNESSRSDTSLERSCLATSTAIVGETVVDSPTTTRMVMLRDRSALGVPSSSGTTDSSTPSGGGVPSGIGGGSNAYSTSVGGTAGLTAESMGVGIMAQGLAWAHRQQERRQRQYLQHQAELQLLKIKQATPLTTMMSQEQQQQQLRSSSILDNATFRSFFSQTSIDSKKCDDAVSSHSTGGGGGLHTGDCFLPNDATDDSNNNHFTITKRISKSGGGYTVEIPVEGGPTNMRQQDDESWIPPVRVVPEDDPPFCLSHNQMQSIAETVLPRGIAYCQWTRLYSLARDGDSFETCMRVVGTHKPTLLVVRTSKNDVFGGLADDSWQPATASAQYCGGPTACLFALTSVAGPSSSSDDDDDDNNYNNHNNDHIEEDERTVTPYKWTGANRYIQLCDTAHRRLAFGGGGNEFGLAVSHDFLFGSTGSSATFGNPPLCDTSPFDICDMEIYGFLIGQF